MDKEEAIKKLDELIHDQEVSDKSTDEFFRHILFLAVSIFGIIISLHTRLPESLYIRLVFALSMGVLLLGVLCIGVSVYDHTMIHKRCLEQHSAEYRKAIQDETCHPLFQTSKKRTRTLLCEKWGLISLVSSLVLLLVYLLFLLLF